jgi:hypothetical protein
MREFPAKTAMHIGMPRSKTGTSRDLMKQSIHIEDRTGAAAACQREKGEQRELRWTLIRIDRSIQQKGTEENKIGQ